MKPCYSDRFGLPSTVWHSFPVEEYRRIEDFSGADPHEGDRLGHLKLIFSGLAAHDGMVLDATYRKKIPVAIAIAMAAGYGNDIRDTDTVHLRMIAIETEYALRWQDDRSSSVWRIAIFLIHL